MGNTKTINNTISDFWAKNLKGFRYQSSLFTLSEQENPEGHLVYKYNISSLINSLKGKCDYLETDNNSFIFIQSILKILFFKYTDQDDIIIGSSPSIYTKCYNNLVFLRSKIQQEETFYDFYKKEQHNVSNIFKIIEGFGEDYTSKFDFDTNRSLLNVGFYDTDFNIETRLLKKFDLLFQVSKKNNSFFEISITSKSYIDESTIKCFINNFKYLIEEVVLNPNIPTKNINILDPREKKKILDLGKPELINEDESNIIELFDISVANEPNKIAIVEGDKFITYSELDKESNKVSQFLHNKGVKKNGVVAILCERSIDMIIYTIGTLKANGVYLPLELKYPEDRIMDILKDSNAQFVITDEEALKKISYTRLQNLFGFKNAIKKNKDRKLCNFNELAHPDRTLVNYDKYFNYVGLAMVKKAVAIQATRGCPFKCAYCHRVWPNDLSYRTAENIFEEIMPLYEQGVRQFSFIDDIFNFNIKESSKFYRLVIKNKLNIQIFLTNGIRADILTKDYIDLMVEAGVVNIGLALETATPRLQKLLKKNLNLDKFKSNVDYICERYPHVILDLTSMIGIPTETEEEAMNTLKFINSFKWIHFPYTFILKIHPNTEIGQIAIDNGVSHKDIIASMNQSYNEIPQTLPFPKTFVQKYHAKFLNEYFLNKERILHVLPYQMKIATEDEIIKKYNNYLPVEINNFDDILEYAKILPHEIDKQQLRKEESLCISLNKTIHCKPQINKSLKVLLIDLSDLFSWHKQLILHDEIVEPLGLMYILSNLKKQFPKQVDGKIIKSRVDFDNYSELIDFLDEFNPDIIGIRTLSVYKDFFHRTVAVIKEKKESVSIIAGGPYATLDYNLVLQDLNVDIAVLGEGEKTFSDLIETIIDNDNKLPDVSNLASIAGLAYLGKNELIQKSREVIVIEDFRDSIMNCPAEKVTNSINLDDSSFVIYTSGSTGKPKGILQTHRCLKNVVTNQVQYGGFQQGLNVLQFSSVGFDVFIAHELFFSLLSKGTLIISDDSQKENIRELGQLIINKNIECVIFTVSLIKALVENDNNFRNNSKALKHLVSTGEQLNLNSTLIDFFKSNKHITLHNFYGPSETHNASNYSINSFTEKIESSLPIGIPSINTWIYILDSNKKVLPLGAAGEIYIGGDSLAHGYVNDPEMTHSKFIELLEFNDRFYRSGDIGRWNRDSSLQFLGRIDDQIKINGIRIEPSEIENTILQYPLIKNAIVTYYKKTDASVMLAAYIICEDNTEISNIKEFLGRRIPEYMIPAHIIKLTNFPLNTNGKVDYKSLPMPFDGIDNKNILLPRTDIERRIANVWAEVLEINNNIDIDSDFFSLGGHSLKAIVLMSKLEKLLGKKISLKELFRYPSIREFCQNISINLTETQV